ncbi:hypothetical protein AMECASPLE_023179 [Ameca splendens]|uniref:Uncharacterized protein n=1 Tax=Ameca splendens TaxID=208324 RepID=A0ABV0ZPR5_9TELE
MEEAVENDLLEFIPRINPYQVVQLDRLDSLTPCLPSLFHQFPLHCLLSLSDSKIFSSSPLTQTSFSSSSLISSPFALSVASFTCDPPGLCIILPSSYLTVSSSFSSLTFCQTS